MIDLARISSLAFPSKNFKYEGDSATIALSGTAAWLASAFGNGSSYASLRFLARVLGDMDFTLYAFALTIFNIVSATLAIVLLSTAIMALVLSVLGMGLASIFSCTWSPHDREGRVITVMLVHFLRS
jgi:hypothetical protein